MLILVECNFFVACDSAQLDAQSAVKEHERNTEFFFLIYVVKTTPVTVEP